MEYNRKGKYNPVTMQYEYEPELDEITGDPFEDMRNRIFPPNERKKINEYKGARAMQRLFRGYSKRKDYPKRLEEYKNNLKRQQEMSSKKKKVLNKMYRERKNMLARQQSYDAKYNKPRSNKENIIGLNEGLERKISYNEDKPQIPEYILDDALEDFDRREPFSRRSFFVPKTKQELELPDEDDEYMFAPLSSAKLNRNPRKSKSNWFRFGKYGGKKKTRKKKKGGIHEIIIPALLVGANNLSKKKRKSKKQKKNKTKSKK